MDVATERYLLTVKLCVFCNSIRTLILNMISRLIDNVDSKATEQRNV